MMDLVRFNLSFLPVEVYVSFCVEGYKKLCKKKKYDIDMSYLDSNAAMTRVITEKDKEPVICMCFDLKYLRKQDKCVAAGLVAHECVHTLAYICDAIGQSERKDNEWEAYLLQQMVVDILQFVYGEEK